MEIMREWKRKRRNLVVKITTFAFVFYLFLPVSIGLFPDFMSQPRIGWISIAWIYSFTQIGMTWLLGWIYWEKSKELDDFIAQMKRESEATE